MFLFILTIDKFGASLQNSPNLEVPTDQKTELEKEEKIADPEPDELQTDVF